MIDLYCERMGPGLFAEPLNSLSNLGFFIAALMAWRLANRSAGGWVERWLLPALMAATGFGSLLFHLYADKFTQLLDVAFLLLFQLVYLWLFMRRLWPRPAILAVSVCALFLIALFLAAGYPGLLNGSLLYLPTWLALLAMTGLLWHLRRPAMREALVATLLFSMSLLLRTVDNALCAAVPIGSHFVWHLLNAMVMLLMFRVLLLQGGVRV